MNSLLIAGLIVSVLTAMSSEIEKESDGSTGLNQSRKHKLIETRVTQIGAIFLVAGFALQIVAHTKA